MRTAEELLESAKALLLDFDGPITALMPPPLNAQAADRARAAVADYELPHDLLATTDHLAVLRYVAEHAPSLHAQVEEACTAAEVAAAQISEPSPEAAWLLNSAERRGIPIAIVSNNSETAVRTFLDRLGWSDRVAALACRHPRDAALMKPHPHLLQVALQALAVNPRAATFVGDSVSDVAAGHAAGVATVGVAKTPARRRDLLNAGADALMLRESGGGRNEISSEVKGGA